MTTEILLTLCFLIHITTLNVQAMRYPSYTDFIFYIIFIFILLFVSLIVNLMRFVIIFNKVLMHVCYIMYVCMSCVHMVGTRVQWLKSVGTHENTVPRPGVTTAILLSSVPGP